MQAWAIWASYVSHGHIPHWLFLIILHIKGKINQNYNNVESIFHGFSCEIWLKVLKTESHVKTENKLVIIRQIDRT